MVIDELNKYKNYEKLFIGYGYREGKQVPIGISRYDINLHTHILGAQGSGKSTLLTLLAFESIRKGFTTIVVDPHGSLIKEIYEYTPPHVETLIVGPGYEGIQLFPYVNLELIKEQERAQVLPTETEIDVRKELIDVIEKGFSAHFSSDESTAKGIWGANVSIINKLALETLSIDLSPTRSIKKLREIVFKSEVRRQILENARRLKYLAGEVAELESMWAEEYENNILKSPHATQTVMGYINKISILYNSPAKTKVIAGKHTLHTFMKATIPKLLLLYLPEGGDWSKLVGALLFASLSAAAYSRSADWENLGYTPVHIIIDEVSTFLSSTSLLVDIITKIRKFGVGFTLAHQNFAQLGKKKEEFGQTIGAQVQHTILMSVTEEAGEYLKGRITKADIEYLKPQPVGHFLLIDRKQRKFRGRSFYYKDIIPRMREMPAPQFTVEKREKEQLGVYQFIPQVVEKYDDISSYDILNTSLSELPHIVVPPDLKTHYLPVSYLFPSPATPVLLALGTQCMLRDKKGFPWLEGWHVGIIQLGQSKIPVLFDTHSYYKEGNYTVKYIIAVGGVIDNENTFVLYKQYLQALCNLLQGYTHKPPHYAMLYEYGFKEEQLLQIKQIKIATPSWLQTFYVLLRVSDTLPSSVYDTLTDELAEASLCLYDEQIVTSGLSNAMLFTVKRLSISDDYKKLV